MSKRGNQEMSKEELDKFEQEHPIIVSDANVNSMSDLDIVTHEETPETSLPADDVPTTSFKGFIYRPMRVQDDILKRASDATGLQFTDVISVALILLQNATLPELRQAISAHSGDKAEALLQALKG